MTILHINDNDLLLYHAGKSVRTQGYARIFDDQVLFDLENSDKPVDYCRIAPQETHSRFWQDCTQTPITKNAAGMRHSADLIWKHLGELKSTVGFDQLYLVVPSHYQEVNLQLLLGVAKSQGIAINGIANKAVCALAEITCDSAEAIHVDVQLHQTVVSRIEFGSDVALGSVEVWSDIGIHDLQENLLKAIQKKFIAADRFDPLHNAESEQQLFNQLPSLVRGVQQTGKAVAGVKNSGHTHSATIDSNDINGAFVELCSRIKQNAQSSNIQNVYIDLNAAFGDVLPEALLTVGKPLLKRTPLQLDSRFDLSVDGDVRYQTELGRHPAASSSIETKATSTVTDRKTLADKKVNLANTATPSAESDALAQQATHLLQFGQAFPIERCQVVAKEGRLQCEASNEGNVAKWLASGDLRIINAPHRKELNYDDRLDSPLADGMLTAIRVNND